MSKLISKCCKAFVRVEPEQQLANPEGHTFHYVCVNCGKACDLEKS